MSLEEGRKKTNKRTKKKKKKNHNKNIKPKMFHKREKNKIKSNYQRRSPIGQNPPPVGERGSDGDIACSRKVRNTGE